MCGLAGVLSSSADSGRSPPMSCARPRRDGGRPGPRGPDGYGGVDGPVGRGVPGPPPPGDHRPVGPAAGSRWCHATAATCWCSTGRSTTTRDEPAADGGRRAVAGAQRHRGAAGAARSSTAGGTLAEVNGMFALALWDRRDRTLSSARDRLGEKPMYYGVAGGSSSSPRSVRRCGSPEVRRSHRPRGGRVALRHSYVPGPYTIIEGCTSSHPVIRSRCGAAAARRGGSRRSGSSGGRGAGTRRSAPNEEELLDEPRRCWRSPCGMRMVADVPLGAFLSGGIDSSFVVALMQRVATEPVRTFTVSVGGRHDERRHAAAVARHLGTRAHRDRPGRVGCTRPGHPAADDLRRALRRPLGHPHVPDVCRGPAARHRLSER